MRMPPRIPPPPSESTAVELGKRVLQQLDFDDLETTATKHPDISHGLAIAVGVLTKKEFCPIPDLAKIVIQTGLALLAAHEYGEQIKAQN